MLKAPVSTAATANRNRTSPVASFSKLSPSRNVLSRRGNFTRCKTARADTASGGETMAPSATQAAQGNAGTSSFVTTATTPVVNSTAPMASDKIPRKCLRKEAWAVNHAPSANNGGRKINSTNSGFRWMVGSPGVKASAPPPTSNATAGGKESRDAK